MSQHQKLKNVEKLKAARLELGWTQAELAKELGLDRSYLSQLESGAKPIQGWVMERLEVLRKLNVEKTTALTLRDEGLEYVERGLLRRVPVVSFARAGADGFNYDDLARQFDDTVQTDCKDANSFALFVEGDSMLPRIEPGEILVVAPNDAPRNGDVVVARLNQTGGVLLKVYHQVGARGERVRLTSYNSAVYPPLEYDRSEFRFIYPVHEIVNRMRRR